MMLLFWITPKVNKSMHFQDGWLSGAPSLALGHNETTWPPSENSHAHSLISIALTPVGITLFWSHTRQKVWSCNFKMYVFIILHICIKYKFKYFEINKIYIEVLVISSHPPVVSLMHPTWAPTKRTPEAHLRRIVFEMKFTFSYVLRGYNN